MDFNLAPPALGRQFVDAVLAHEGGYVNNPLDRGGETIWGVTAATARKAGYTGEMRLMTRDQAISIYLWFFWTNRFDLVAARNMPRLAYALMDFGVNSGTGRPAEALQRALNALNLNGKRWPDIAVDGGIGPKTLNAIASARYLYPDAEKLLTFAVNSLRASFIIDLAERSPTQETFMLGWLRRFLEVAEVSGG